MKPPTYKIPTYTCRFVRDGYVKLPAETADLSSFEQAKAALQFLTKDSPVELFVILFLDGRNRLIGSETAAKGGQHGCALMARDILRSALVSGASGFIVGHNHPSGDPKPSAEDIVLTESLLQAARSIGLPFLDHIIVARGTDRAVSLFELGCFNR
ncbi:RadC-like JAB domain protein [uncultured archaeon]|nr:RadC-like JAB domain protein [uncultured archaeon]